MRRNSIICGRFIEYHMMGLPVFPVSLFLSLPLLLIFVYNSCEKEFRKEICVYGI